MHNIDTPFTKVVRKGNLKKVSALLDTGADPNEKDDSGWSALHIAVKKNHFKIIKKLIESGAEIDGEEKNSITPLMEAVEQNNVRIINYLIESGANINATLEDDACPVVDSIKSKKVLKIFIESGAYLDGALGSAIYDHNVKFVRTIIESKAKLYSIDNATGMLELAILNAGRSPKLVEIERLVGKYSG